MDSLDWMLREGSWPHLQQSFKEADEVGHSFTSRIKALKAYQEQFDIAGQQTFPNAAWVEYFAVLSIAYVLEALNPAIFMDPLARGKEAYRFDNMEWPVESMETVCIAECYLKLDELEQAHIKKAKQTGSQGGLKRTEKYDSLKTMLLQTYEEKGYQNRSNHGAAKLLYDQFEEEILKILHTEGPVNRVTKWIGQYKRGEIKLR
ncbi:MAG: hypothetical protein AB2689_28900 [Candidatus Thiodiazotropha taylori]